MKEMRLRSVHLSPIDEHHCLARVAWTSVYARAGESDIAVDFDVHYFLQSLEGMPKVFGWVSGDEQALFKERGVIE